MLYCEPPVLKVLIVTHDPGDGQLIELAFRHMTHHEAHIATATTRGAA